MIVSFLSLNLFHEDHVTPMYSRNWGKENLSKLPTGALLSSGRQKLTATPWFPPWALPTPICSSSAWLLCLFISSGPLLASGMGLLRCSQLRTLFLSLPCSPLFAGSDWQAGCALPQSWPLWARPQVSIQKAWERTWGPGSERREAAIGQKRCRLKL